MEKRSIVGYNVSMNSIALLIILWGLCAFTRGFLFTRLHLKFWKSLIPIYGTYLLFKRIWTKQMAILYIGSILLFPIIQNSSYTGTITSIVLFACLVVQFIGWTGQAYYCAKELDESSVNGLLLALLFPIIAIKMGIKKS